MSIVQDIINELLNVPNNTLLDVDLSMSLNLSKHRIQKEISRIKFNRTKWNSVVLIRHGKKGNYSREINNLNSNQNDFLNKNNRDLDLRKGINQFSAAGKKAALSLKTNQGIKNRALLLNRIMQQNLNVLIEAQNALK